MATSICPRCRSEIESLWMTCPMCGGKTQARREMEEAQKAACRGQVWRTALFLTVIGFLLWGLNHGLLFLINSASHALPAAGGGSAPPVP